MIVKNPRLVAALALVVATVFLTGCGQEEREVTTVSDEAYACFEDGTAAVERFRLVDARDSFLKAVEFDPEFAMAWCDLAVMQWQLGERDQAQASVDKALEVSGSASEVETMWIKRVPSPMR